MLAQYGAQPFPFFLSYTAGRVLLAEGKLIEAEEKFAEAARGLQDADYVVVRIEVQVWQTECLQALGRHAEAQVLFQKVIQAAQTENVIRPFIEAREGLLPLLAESKQEGSSWVREALQGRDEPAGTPPLTRREREILSLLAAGLSNREMAARLVIAEGTLKRHIANLYRKLGVHNRTQAIHRYLNQ